jgi:RNA polymerase sigma factor (TIGR02999 family)
VTASDAATAVTKLLLDWESGDPGVEERLMPLLYDDLHRRAEHYLRRERRGHTLQPTALVNEAYLRLVDQKRAGWKNRAQFFGVAAQAMRRILVDHARRRSTEKRGDGVSILPLDEAIGSPWKRDADLVALDDALEALAKLAPRASRVVELRFFGGLTIDETAAALEISPATVKTDWQQAKAWLYRQLSRSEADGA